MTDTTQLTEFCVHLKVVKGRESAFLEASRANQTGARREPGNRRFDIYRSRTFPERFLFVEAYDSVEAVTKHRESAHFKAWLETAGPMLSEPRERVAGQAVPAEYEKVDS
jgi:quinol monooxygenase YgiN